MKRNRKASARMSGTNPQMKPLTMMGICAATLSFLTPAYGQVSVGQWEIHKGDGPIDMPTPDLKSQKKALDDAKIPTQNDPEWIVSTALSVDVDVPSVCRGQNQQVDYMFFQVVVNVPTGTKVDKFQVRFDQVDDAARVSIFNKQNPNGKFYPDADVIQKQKNLTVMSDFKNDVVEGENRVVITQYDWAPSGNHIKGIRILVNGSEVTPTKVVQVGSTEVDLGGAKMKMAAVPKATFWMGGGADNAPVKEVEVGAFYIGVTEVTQAQWKAVMGNDSTSKFKGDNFPVETVSWNDVQKFIAALNQKTKGNGYEYRLPTEFEWEYACRGGATSKADCSFDFYFDQPTNNLSTAEANFDGNHPRGNGIKTKSLGTTVNVGSYKPNKLGLYDMHGNVWEWTDTLEGSGRVLRGAHWGDSGLSCKASARLTNAPDGLNENLGFRLAASASNVNVQTTTAPVETKTPGETVMKETPPANAMKLDVAGGPFTFGYSTAAQPGFHEFEKTDSPYPGITRRNRKDGDAWFSFAQNTGDAASDPTKTGTVHYPAKNEGSGVLHPGPKLGDVAMARFTAERDGVYNFEVTTTLIHEGPTGAGITISVGKDDLVKQEHLTDHLVPSKTSFQRKLKKGETVDIAVDSGKDSNYEKDHVLLTAKAWTTAP